MLLSNVLARKWMPEYGKGIASVKCKLHYLVLFAVPFLTSCASPLMVSSPVGPGPMANGASIPGKGDLQVYSETEEYGDSAAVPYFPHSDYFVYAADGKRLKRVANHQNHEDETPARVDLPPGRYLVKAQAEFYGPILVPVVIRPNQTTRLILQPGWKPDVAFAGGKTVRLPKGYCIGWLAN